MIIVRIFGGLGNQLFQYAAAKTLAKKHETNLKLDVSEFADYQLRSFELSRLNTEFEIASLPEIWAYKPSSKASRIIQRFTPYSHRRFYKEPHFHFDKKYFQLGDEVYLQGYFQSEKYFLSIRETIAEEFDLTHLVEEKHRQLSVMLQSKQSVAIHIRLGDYQDAEMLRVHGVLPVDYYSKAIQYLKKKLSQPEFFIFSDAPEKVMADLQLPEATIISGRLTSNHFEDLYLMSQCKHNIIANSSFSWWGAWLNKNSDKIVIGPKNWFNQGPKDTYDIMPESWIKI